MKAIFFGIAVGAAAIDFILRFVESIVNAGIL